ncbi:ABC transporter permease [Methanobrevibacter filiformis]|uniref:Putative ABC transporter permease YknZ n=1 Tax=Methanobrevibacter filiformis TaxID=55758 RepID=A0A166DT71_9EURY|nr:ABC transporter permease [Methanobrevibacter filiformis]KZX15928.1 putative ABC transporter permease YknZ [Methanobrevibacter filiformis]
MSFLTLIFKNPFRNKARAFLAVIGIGIGIATIVALGGITTGLTQSLDNTLHEGGADFTVLSKKEDSQGTPYGTETLDEDWLNKLKEIPGIKRVEGIYIATVPVEDKFGMVIGIDPNNTFDISSMDVSLTSGQFIKNEHEVVIGKLKAKDLNKKVGDNLTIDDSEFKIVGIYESGDPSQDGVMAHMKDLQKISDEEGKISMIYVFADSGADVDTITKSIDNKYGDDLNTITSINDIKMVADALNMVNGASWGISLLAIVIGGIGIINTMIMSVYERTREIGVLKAVGWKKKRILSMILGESLVLTVTSAIVGSIFGVIAIELAVALGILSGMTPVFTMGTFIQGFAVAIIVGLIGGLYPAWRASRLPATESLRYE